MPSANLSYNFTPKMLVRAAYGLTVTHSEFLFDITGKLIHNVTDENMLDGTNKKEVSTENLTRGFYLLRIEADDATQTLKHIVN